MFETYVAIRNEKDAQAKYRTIIVGAVSTTLGALAALVALAAIGTANSEES